MRVIEPDQPRRYGQVQDALAWHVVDLEPAPEASARVAAFERDVPAGRFP